MHGRQYRTTEIYMVSTKRESILNRNHLAPVLFFFHFRLQLCAIRFYHFKPHLACTRTAFFKIFG